MEPETRIQIEYDDQTPLEPGQYLVMMGDDTGVEVTVEVNVGRKIVTLHRLTISGMPVIFPARVATPSGALVAALYDGLVYAYKAGAHRLHEVVNEQREEKDRMIGKLEEIAEAIEPGSVARRKEADGD